jgi:hypothetical protein
MATSRFQNLRVALAAAVVAQLTTDGTTGVTVSEYPPLGDQFTREDRVWLGEISGTQEPYTQGASGSRMEELTVDLKVFAPVFGGTEDEQREGEARAELIFASVENAVRGDITVSSTVYNIELESFTSTVGQIDEHGPAGFIEAVLVAEAHI